MNDQTDAPLLRVMEDARVRLAILTSEGAWRARTSQNTDNGYVSFGELRRVLKAEIQAGNVPDFDAGVELALRIISSLSDSYAKEGTYGLIEFEQQCGYSDDEGSGPRRAGSRWGHE